MRIIIMFFKWLSLGISGLALFRNYNILEKNNKLNTFLSSDISEIIKYSINDTDLRIGFLFFIGFLIIFIILSVKLYNIKINYIKKINKIHEITNNIKNNGEIISEDMLILSKPKEPKMNGFLVLILMGVLYLIFTMAYFTIFGKKNTSIVPVIDPSMALSLLIILFIVLYKLFKPSPKRWAEYEYQKAIYYDRLKLNEQFKSKFIILNDFDESKYVNIKIINISDATQERAMFRIYIQAELSKADAIVLNDSNVASQVYSNISSDSKGNVSGHTSSSNTFHFTATLAKRIDK